MTPAHRCYSRVFAGRPMQWYSTPSAAITAGSYRLRPSNTTGVRSVALMSSKSGVRNSSHSVTMARSSDHPRPDAPLHR